MSTRRAQTRASANGDVIDGLTVAELTAEIALLATLRQQLHTRRFESENGSTPAVAGRAALGRSQRLLAGHAGEVLDLVSCDGDAILGNARSLALELQALGAAAGERVQRARAHLFCYLSFDMR